MRRLALRHWPLPLLLALLAACGTSPSTPPPPVPPIIGGQPVPAPAEPRPSISVENLDGFPFPDRLVFNRIEDNDGRFLVHDRSTLRVNNAGSAALHLYSATLDPNWVFVQPLSFPQTVPPGGHLDLALRFTGSQNHTLPPRLYSGTLTLTSDDPLTPIRAVHLAGLWQGASETFALSGRYDEPSLDLIRQTLGLGFTLSTPADAAPPTGLEDGSNVPINQRGAVRAQGDEVLSAYWLAADPSKQVTAVQVGAWSQQKATATLNWYAKGRFNQGDLTPVAQRQSNNAQALMPLGSSGSFTPNGPFGLNVDVFEWSDSTINAQDTDRQKGCLYPVYNNVGKLCGSHVRFWPMTDDKGTVVPNSYFMVVDFGGYNYDYQDEIYVLKNLKPAPILLKAGLNQNFYTGPDGRVWGPDRLDNGNAFISPAEATNEPATPYTGPIANTTDPELYRTYRAYISKTTSQDQHRLVFTVPLNNGTYSVKLHFAEQFWNAASKRLFDVAMNGQTRLSNLDIFNEAGGKYTALVKQLDNVQVMNGKLVVTLSASVDYPAISAIEVLR